MVYTLLLLLVLCPVIFKSSGDRYFDNIYLVITFSSFAFVTAFRADFVGIDTQQYINIYYRLLGCDMSNYTDYYNVEPGFFLVNKIVADSDGDSRWVFIFCALITSFGGAVFIKKFSSNVCESTLLYFLFILPRTMNICRQYVAISFLLLAIICAFERRKILTIIFSLLMVLFHYSSFITLPIVYLFCIHEKVNKKTILYICVTLVLLTAFSGVLFSYMPGDFKYYHYMDSDAQWENGVSWKYMIIFLIVLYLGVKGSRNNTTESKTETAYLLFLSLFILMIYFYLAGAQWWILNRLYDYFYVMFIVSMPLIMSKYCINHRDNTLKYILYCLLIYAGMNSIFAGIAGAYPFEFCF